MILLSETKIAGNPKQEGPKKGEVKKEDPESEDAQAKESRVPKAPDGAKDPKGSD